MINSLLGSKAKMSQTFVEGTRVPITWIKLGPCIVTQIKTNEKDGYWAVQLGFGHQYIRKITKPLLGHLRGVIKDLPAQAGKKAPRFLREIIFDNKPDLKIGDVIKLEDIFKVGDLVNITGISKGKGFAGVVKRWHFAGGPKTHGQSDRQRAPGSIGSTTTPGRVYKGKKMAGRMGGDRITIRNLIITQINKDKGEIAVSGPVPGSGQGLLLVRKIASGKLKELTKEVPEIKVSQKEVEGEEKEKQPKESVAEVAPNKEEKEVKNE